MSSPPEDVENLDVPAVRNEDVGLLYTGAQEMRRQNGALGDTMRSERASRQVEGGRNHRAGPRPSWMSSRISQRIRRRRNQCR
ncbi:hypothetical protein OG462_40810 [Streptomyces sp. NBC_01077]|uniref:hypothetical protein n=1 Tax=Streptomyces sp. NBC_01077 TaxID=2903746 RepID=UPI0038673675|nr:hypothetical protein OG462_40810 [Streptomyces sp. NBC_01077]